MKSRLILEKKLHSTTKQTQTYRSKYSKAALSSKAFFIKSNVGLSVHDLECMVVTTKGTLMQAARLLLDEKIT